MLVAYFNARTKALLYDVIHVRNDKCAITDMPFAMSIAISPWCMVAVIWAGLS